jgi:hypothetical protein
MRPELWGTPDAYSWDTIIRVAITLFLVTPGLVGLTYAFFKSVEHIRDRMWKDQYRK